MSEEGRERIRQSKLGSKNPAWKEKPSYKSLHTWIREHLPNGGICQHCGTTEKKLNVASVGHVYTRDFSTWKWLCLSCHRKMDGVVPPSGRWLGRKHSLESRKKMSESRKLLFIKRKLVNRHDMSISTTKKK